MLSELAWLALEVKYVEPARSFYTEALDLPVVAETEAENGAEDGVELTLEAGETDFVLRRPTSVPRGGLHTHFAFSIPAAEYEEWWDRLETDFDLEEFRFGSTKSLYLYDPDGNCVELGQTDVAGPGIDGIFEVVLEVESLARAEEFYTALGFELVDRGETRRRVRLTGPVDLELWEPQLGIADARGGVHVDLGFELEAEDEIEGETEDGPLERVHETLEGRASSLERKPESVVARDPDGHHLTFR